MSTPPDDKDLEDYLSGTSDVSRRYRTSANDEPPAELDQAVLAQARAAVEALPPQVTRLPARRPRWVVPFALAATVLLSFAIFREAGVGTGVMTIESSAPGDQVVALTQEAPVVPAEQSAAEARREAEPQSRAKATQGLASAESAAVATVPVIAPPETAASVAADAPAPAPAPNPMPFQRASSVRPSARAAAPPSGAVGRNELAAAEALRTPEIWLEDIRKLRADGQRTEADAEMVLFMAAYPDYFERNPGIARP